MYCHENNIVHRDLKPENILLEQGKDMSQIKIIDFGISVHHSGSEILTESIGTPYYISPEIWNKNYGKECDLWSSGVILYIMLSGTPPFNAPTDKEIKQKILKGDYSLTDAVWNGISSEAKDLIQRLLEYDSS